MANYLADAFAEALDAAEDEVGSRKKVNFRGGDIDRLAYDNNEDRLPGPGGEYSASVLLVSIPLASIVLPIAELEPITVEGKVLAVFDFTVAEGRIDLHVGDPAKFNAES